MTDTLSINNREYPSILKKTSIVICLDGSQKEYLDEASKFIDKSSSKYSYILSETRYYFLANYLGLLQFAFPHGIVNGSEVILNVVDTGEGTEFPLSSGATGRLNGNTTYYAITGTANSLEPDQMKLAITAANAELGDGLAFVNAGTGRQQVLTKAFGATAEANVIT